MWYYSDDKWVKLKLKFSPFSHYNNLNKYPNCYQRLYVTKNNINTLNSDFQEEMIKSYLSETGNINEKSNNKKNELTKHLENNENNFIDIRLKLKTDDSNYIRKELEIHNSFLEQDYLNNHTNFFNGPNSVSTISNNDLNSKKNNLKETLRGKIEQKTAELAELNKKKKIQLEIQEEKSNYSKGSSRIIISNDVSFASNKSFLAQQSLINEKSSNHNKINNNFGKIFNKELEINSLEEFYKQFDNFNESENSKDESEDEIKNQFDNFYNS